MSNGFTGGGGGAGGPIGVIIGAIVSLVNFLLGSDGGMKRALQSLATATQFGFAHLQVVLGAFGAWVLHALRSIARALNQLVRVVLNNFLYRIWWALQRLKDRIAAILLPVIRYLQQVRAYFDFIFTRYIAPVLNLIQRLRQTLLLFRVLHLRFAERLDRRLAQLEADIAAPFLRIRGELNKAISYLQLLGDPFGLLRLDQYLLAAIRSIGQLIAVIHAAQTRPLFASELADNDFYHGLLYRSDANREAGYRARLMAQADRTEAAYRAGEL